MTSWLLLQLADASLPSGGFAHSAGLEAAHQAGLVRTQAELGRFLDDAIVQAGSFALPLVNAAHAHPERLMALGRTADALLANHVANRASRAQGRGLLDATGRAFESAELERARRDTSRGALLPHAAPVLGAVGAFLGLGREETQRWSLHLALRSLLSAAVRLGLVGPFEAQALHHRRAALLERTLAENAAAEADDVAQTAPIAELFAMTHDRLYTRLFQS